MNLNISYKYNHMYIYHIGCNYNTFSGLKTWIIISVKLNTRLEYMHYAQERIQGEGQRGQSPPWAFSGGGLSPPWELSPAWAIQGGDSKNPGKCPPPERFRGGTNIFFSIFSCKLILKKCKILWEYKKFSGAPRPDRNFPP